MISIPMEYGLIFAGFLFATGLTGLLMRRNLVFMMISVEIMLNAAGIAFITAGAKWVQADAQVMFIFILTVAAAELSVGLALLIQLHHHFETIDSESVSNMRG
jgi:NADH-quinone oxidoreductase subunit K